MAVFEFFLVFGGLIGSLVVSMYLVFAGGLSYNVYDFFLHDTWQAPTLLEFTIFIFIDLTVIGALFWFAFLSKLMDALKAVALGFVVLYLFFTIMWLADQDALNNSMAFFGFNFVLLIVGSIILFRFFEKHHLTWHYYLTVIALAIIGFMANFGALMGS